MDAQRALLDELMGTARDLTEEEKKEHKEVKWDDPDVCGPFMVRFCPHDLFINTKSNLALTLEENIKKMLVQVEELGEAGKVDEAEALMKQVDVLNAQKTALTNQIDNKMAMLDKKMELCETCGSFLVSDDVLERTQSHVTGKQHIGYGMATKEKAREEEKLAREKKADEQAVEERGPMTTEIEDQSTETVSTEMEGILVEVDTDIGVGSESRFISNEAEDRLMLEGLHC
ncbi:hypothetical protein PR202_ga25373 [Eleusine coracana subsp. coracana]|uniref:Luc7-like protein 3 n=1 Tax=Eleusine coracana subsp. coracana TaxID=191504 RepID=A0AAV5DB85_ELECO|nr:hypothetical protein PR202_ga25373 [Eleusine coracana subsp. coracana]